jgi:hypothetical protein
MPWERHRLLQIAFPAGEPGPVGIDMILRAAIEADLNRLPASPARLWSTSFRLTAVSAFVVRIHLFAGILRFWPGPMQV